MKPSQHNPFADRGTLHCQMVPFTAKCQRYTTLHCQIYPSLPKVRGTIPFTAKCTFRCQRYPSLPNARGTVPFTAKCICLAAPLHLPPVPSSLSDVQRVQQVAHFTHNLITCASSSYDLCKNHSRGEKERGQRGEKEREKSRERRKIKRGQSGERQGGEQRLSLIHISEPTRR